MTVRAYILILCSIPVAAANPGWVGSKACASCHAEIYRKYLSTPMARTSGPAASAAVPEQSFVANGYRYAIAHQPGKLYLEFRKTGTDAVVRRELAWFAGSGGRARSYFIDVDGFLYEAPATYYGGAREWALSPGYGQYRYPFLARAIAPGCLECHATGIRPVSGTQNGYRSPPFLEGGVGCERCHGPGARHAASGKAADIVNPASLAPGERESVCAQCHLSGEIRVERAGKSMSDFTAGDNLSDYAVAFVRTASSGMKVTSHVENLAQSACSRASGGRLWCGFCHDPHFIPAPAEKAAYFRAKCQTCHAAAVCSRGPDCIECHMPRSPVRDAEHVVYTDHSIPRRPKPRNEMPPADAALVAFGKAQANARDQGLAYAIVALREQNRTYSARAFDLLREAERRDHDDPQTLAYLADLYKTRHDDRTAATLYQRLYQIDSSQSSAPINLGAYAMEQGRNEEAIPLFQQALRISPALVLVRLDLAVALIRTGKTGEARSVLEKALEFNPSFTAAQDLLNQIR